MRIAQGLPVSSLMLHRKALCIACDAGIPARLFGASRGWVKGFLRRHRLALRARTRQGQVTPENAGAALKLFNVKVKQKMAELGVDAVYIADQTPVFFEYLPKSTITAKGARTVWVRSTGKDKERLTCMLLGDSLGRKYPPCVIVKTKPSKVIATREDNAKKRHGFGKRMWKTLKPLQRQHNIALYANENGWWNEGLTVDFLCFHFGRRANMTVPVLLLLDEFSGHWTEAVLTCAKDLNVDLMRVPAGCTGVCQTADILWNRPLKIRLRERWINFLESQMERHEVAMTTSTPFNMMPPSRANVVEWVAGAWGDLSADTIANGFGCVLKESGDDSEATVQIHGVVDRLERLGLLDQQIGEVDPEQDVIDRVFHDLDYAVV